MGDKMKGKLYLVATPIGNLEDITLRAINVLKEVDLIAAEDTRNTLKLLNHLQISKPLISYYKEIEKQKKHIIIEKILEGKNVAVVSDAGTPAISDPGEEIVKEAIKENIDVVPIPGAVAGISALICSGFSTKRFEFIGFLPVNKKEKVEILESIKLDKKTIILYEAPHRLKKTLEEIKCVLGNRCIVLAREITKIHEEFIRGNLEDVLNKLKEPRGEFVIIIEGSTLNKNELQIENLSKLSLNEHYDYYKNLGFEKKDIIKQVAKDRGVTKNEVYKFFF